MQQPNSKKLEEGWVQPSHNDSWIQLVKIIGCAQGGINPRTMKVGINFLVPHPSLGLGDLSR